MSGKNPLSDSSGITDQPDPRSSGCLAAISGRDRRTNWIRLQNGAFAGLQARNGGSARSVPAGTSFKSAETKVEIKNVFLLGASSSWILSLEFWKTLEN